MIRKISHITLLVDDPDAARDWYVDKLGFEVVVDREARGQRWLTISPPGQDLEVVLATPEGAADGAERSLQEEALGSLPGWVLTVDDCRRRVDELRQAGVEVVREPAEVPWGISAVIADPHGYKHNLLEPAGPSEAGSKGTSQDRGPGIR